MLKKVIATLVIGTVMSSSAAHADWKEYTTETATGAYEWVSGLFDSEPTLEDILEQADKDAKRMEMELLKECIIELKEQFPTATGEQLKFACEEA